MAFTKIEDAQGWASCLGAGCSGSNSGASFWMAQNQTSPSLDGSSAHFYVSGNQYADVLWWKQLPPVPWASHYLLDFWLKPDPDTLAHSQSIEFDMVQTVNGRKFNLSSQCYYAQGSWNTWNEPAVQWVRTNIPCNKFDPNTWHHIKIYAERTASQTHYISYTIDGVTYPVADQYAWHDTVGSSSTTQNVQIQMDINSSPGSVGEFIDQLTLYLW